MKRSSNISGLAALIAIGWIDSVQVPGGTIYQLSNLAKRDLPCLEEGVYEADLEKESSR